MSVRWYDPWLKIKTVLHDGFRIVMYTVTSKINNTFKSVSPSPGTVRSHLRLFFPVSQKYTATPWPGIHPPFQPTFCSHNSPWLAGKLFRGVGGEHASPIPLVWLESKRGLREVHLGFNTEFFFSSHFFNALFLWLYLHIFIGFLGKSRKKLQQFWQHSVMSKCF